MPSLYFKGKSAVWNHHLSVPYHTLEKDNKASLKGENDDENLIIEGDNLLALKALLPKYQGKIKCIYIDPPYNTGNEKWIYSDNVNSPLIEDWVGGVVGIDDLTRHDKWLCMMTPRLKILRELLSDDGVIFISIDDNEFSHLRDLMDEIFYEKNFIDTIVWKKKSGAGNTESYIGVLTEYILVYGKDKVQVKLNRRKIDKDYGFWDEKAQAWYALEGLLKTDKGAYKRDTMKFPMVDPKTKEKVFPPDGKRWTVGMNTYEEFTQQGLLVFLKDKSGNTIVKQKKYLTDFGADGVFLNLLESKGSLESAKDELESLGFERELFDTPKPSILVKHLLSIATNKDDIILDSFAGSGTTSQAVLELNKEIIGNRKFILVEMEDYADNITAERARRVIKNSKNKIGFTYYKLGPSIDADSILAGKLPKYEEFAKYAFYLATGRNHPDDKKIKEKDYFAGKLGNESIYLIYKQDLNTLKKLAITLEWAEETNKKDSGKKIVYAPACFLDDEYLEKFNIQFVSIPYNLFEKK